MINRIIERCIGWLEEFLFRRCISAPARRLNLIDLGASVERDLNGKIVGHSMHLCGKVSREGIGRVTGHCLRWCYYCEIAWPHDEDDDHGGRRGSQTPTSPIPPSDFSRRAQEEAKKLFARLRQKSWAELDERCE